MHVAVKHQTHIQQHQYTPQSPRARKMILADSYHKPASVDLC